MIIDTKLIGKGKEEGKTTFNYFSDALPIRFLLISFPTCCTQMNKQSFADRVTICNPR